MENRTTIIYYTSNREEECFESVIREQILCAAGSIAIISVSQKPINFGYNICVGDVGVSNQNAHRQFQIGCLHAKTEFIHSTESDTLYPEEYFKFIPKVNNRAYRTPIYLFKIGGKEFYRKRFSEAATVVGREYAIGSVEKSLEGREMWEGELETGKKVPYTFPHGNWMPFELSVPIINIKTPNQMHKWHGYDQVVYELPFWGKPSDVTRLFK